MATDAPARYNPKNVMLQPHELGHLLTRFGVDAPYTDINIYRRAFVNRSYCTKKNENYVNGNVGCPPGCMPLQEESNERLEYLGDAILNKTIAMYTFQRFPKDNEGFLTIMRTKLVNGVQLAKFAKELGMDRFVIISAQLEESGGRSHKSTLEDAFEAFVAPTIEGRPRLGHEGKHRRAVVRDELQNEAQTQRRFLIHHPSRGRRQMQCDTFSLFNITDNNDRQRGRYEYG